MNDGNQATPRGIAVVVGILLLIQLASGELTIADDVRSTAVHHPGYELLVNKPFVGAALDQELADNLWRSWPEPLRRQAEQMSPEERRRATFDRYGWSDRPDRPGVPLQYTIDQEGRWRTNCFTCHGGRVAGKVIPGAPNSHYAIQTLAEEILLTRSLMGRAPQASELGALLMPLGSTTGTTNAVMFGVVLMGIRDSELNLVERQPQQLVHHDMDAPPWWNYSKRRQLYIDGFAEKSARALMPFLLEPANGPEKFREWESDFEVIEQYLKSIEPPEYPFEIDSTLAETGRLVFEHSCAECHGTYGPDESYPEVTVGIDEIGTDRVRFDALTGEYREGYSRSWFGHFGDSRVLTAPKGYVAPPLDGIWASAPYLHNGSVPTLWHLLHPDERPRIWKRIDPHGFDRDRVGVVAEEIDRFPTGLIDRAELSRVFDTTGFGKSAAGHDYPSALSEQEKRAVLEYLKTL